LLAVRRKAIQIGVDYVNGEVIGFEEMKDGGFISTLKPINTALVDTYDNKLVPIKYHNCINAAGPWASHIARLANIGKMRIDDPNNLVDAICVSLPVEARKRYVYLFYSENGPILNLPFVHDSTGVYFKRHDLLSNYYVCGLNPRCEENEPNNLDLNLIDVDYFENKIKPILIERVPEFKNLKLINGWSGLYDYNTLDKNLIIGKHPVFNNFIFANGSSGHGLQHAAAIGRAVSELVCHGTYKTIDFKRFGFERVMKDFALNDIEN